MEVKVEGYLNQKNNKNVYEYVFGDKKINDIKNIYIRCVDEDCDKIKNILKQYKDPKLHTPIYQAEEGGLLIKLNTQKFSKYIDPEMLKIPRSEWFGKKYSARFLISKYSFKGNTGTIHGLHFILKDIKLI